MKKTPIKLTLNRETLRRLEAREVGSAIGGGVIPDYTDTSANTNVCTVSCYNQC